MNWSKKIPFKVSVAGIIEIMGKSLYSRPETAVRELVQNAHDAVTRRRQIDLQYKGRIDIEQRPAEKQLVFHDDGVGLSPQECEDYLSTLGIGMTGQIRRRSAGEASCSAARRCRRRRRARPAARGRGRRAR